MKETTQKLIDRINSIDEQIKSLKQEQAELKDSVWEDNQEDIETAYRLKGSKFGSVSVGDLSFTTQKKVSWDTPVLMKSFTKLKEAGVELSKVIKLKATVSETEYKKQNEEVKEILDDARTIDFGTKSFKVIEQKGE